MRQRHSETTGHSDGEGISEAVLNDEDFGRVLADLARNGTLVLDGDDEEDPDWQPEEGEEDDDDELEGDGDVQAIDDDDEDEGDPYGYGWSQPGPGGKWFDEVKEPKREGLSLLYNGEFGRIRHQTQSRNKGANIAKILLSRGTKLRA